MTDLRQRNDLSPYRFVLDVSGDVVAYAVVFVHSSRLPALAVRPDPMSEVRVSVMAINEKVGRGPRRKTE